MCEKCLRICNAIGELNSGESNSVTIFADNADFHGSNSRIDVCRDFGDFDNAYFADSIPDALEQAVEEMRATKSQ